MNACSHNALPVTRAIHSLPDYRPTALNITLHESKQELLSYTRSYQTHSSRLAASEGHGLSAFAPPCRTLNIQITVLFLCLRFPAFPLGSTRLGDVAMFYASMMRGSAFTWTTTNPNMFALAAALLPVGMLTVTLLGRKCCLCM